MTHRIREALLWLSGVNRTVLAGCPTEATKFLGVGGAVLTTAVMAACAASLTLGAFLGVPWPIAVPVGLLWGVAILNLDRWLVTATQRQDSWLKNVLIAIPRLALAAVIGVVIAEPIVLAAFSSEINTRAVEMKQDERAERQAKLDKDFARIATLQSETEAIEKKLTSIDSGAAITGNTRYQELKKEVAELTEKEAVAGQAVLCEAEGRCGTNKVGRGPVFKEKVRIWNDLKTQLAEAEDALASLEADLDAAVGKAAVAQTTQLNARLADVTDELKELGQQREAEQKAFDAAQNAKIGLLARIDALHRLADERPPLNAAQWALRLFILALDSLPVLVKLMMAIGKPSLYERQLRMFEDDLAGRTKVRYGEDLEAARIDAATIVDGAKVRRTFELEAADELAKTVVDAQKELARAYIAEWKRAAEEDVRAQIIALSDDLPRQRTVVNGERQRRRA